MKNSTVHLKSHFNLLFISGVLLVGIFFSCSSIDSKSKYFGIRVIDGESGRGIPMVELKMTNSLNYHTDNLGNIAFFESDLMDQDLYFLLSSPGYYFRKDNTGRQGITLRIEAGQNTVIKMRRINLAERLYRITGQGQFVHSDLLSQPALNRSQLNAGVLGQDSNLGTIYKGRYFWIWGDTFLPKTYQGNFSVSAAVSDFPENGGKIPEEGITFRYFVDDQGWTKPMINLNAPGYVWFDWLMPLSISGGNQILAAKYARVNAYFGNYERGVAVYNEEKEIFEKSKEVLEWIDDPHKCDHPFMGYVDSDTFYYLTSEFHFSRVKPVLSHISDPHKYENFTCLKEGEHLNNTPPLLDRDLQGQIRYSWKKETDAIDFAAQRDLLERGLLTKEEAYLHPIDLVSGNPVDVKRGSISWNPFRQRWILIAGATDIWYSEADTPVGPWVYVQKIVSNDQFLYNPVHHSFLDQDGGKRIYFQGTFTKFFSSEPPIPRYDYNQLMYGLDLSHRNLNIPVPIYAVSTKTGLEYAPRSKAINRSKQIDHIPFFAFDRGIKHTSIIPIFRKIKDSNQLVSEVREDQIPLFYAVKPELNMDQLFTGIWETKINFKSFDNFVNIQLIRKENNWEAIPSKESFLLSDTQIKNGVLSMTMIHEGDTYLLNGKIINGVLEGSFTVKGKLSQGTWKAYNQQNTWWASLSPSIVPLFEYKNTKNNTFYYTTEKLFENHEWILSKHVLCHVWKNPTKVISFDFNTRPVLHQ